MVERRRDSDAGEPPGGGPRLLSARVVSRAVPIPRARTARPRPRARGAGRAAHCPGAPPDACGSGRSRRGPVWARHAAGLFLRLPASDGEGQLRERGGVPADPAVAPAPARADRRAVPGSPRPALRVDEPRAAQPLAAGRDRGRPAAQRGAGRRDPGPGRALSTCCSSGTRRPGRRRSGSSPGRRSARRGRSTGSWARPSSPGGCRDSSSRRASVRCGSGRSPAFLLLLPVLYGFSWLADRRDLRARPPACAGSRNGPDGRVGLGRAQPGHAADRAARSTASPCSGSGFPVMYRIYYNRFLYVLLLLILLWMLLRIVDVVDRHLLRRVMPAGRSTGGPSLSLVRRALRGVAFVLVAPARPAGLRRQRDGDAGGPRHRRPGARVRGAEEPRERVRRFRDPRGPATLGGRHLPHRRPARRSRGHHALGHAAAHATNGRW